MMAQKAPKSKSGGITRNVVILGVVSLFTDAASEMIYPLVPVFITLLGSSVLVLGVIEGIAETTAAMLKLISGVISDRMGKRKLLVVIGYGISSLVRPFTGIVASAWQIVFVRMLDRVGKGIRTAPRDALIASSVDSNSRGRAYGFHRAMDHAGAVIGPLLAISVLMLLILVFHMQDTLRILRWTFILAIIPGIFAVLALVLFVHEKIDTVPQKQSTLFSLKQFDKNFLKYIAIVTLFTLGNSSDAFLLFRVQEALNDNNSLYSILYRLPLFREMLEGFGDAEIRKQLINILFVPLVWAFFHVIKVLFSTHLGTLSDRTGRKRVINIGWAIYAFVYLGFAFLNRFDSSLHLPLVFVLFFIYALYYAFTEGAEKAFVADIVAPEIRGSAFGMFNFSIGLSALPASIIFGFLYKSFGAFVAFGTGAFIAFVSMILLAVLVNEKSNTNEIS